MPEPLSPFEQSRVVESAAASTDDGLFDVERRVVESHFTDRDAAVLDLGCGTGRTTAALDRLGFDVVGVDVSEPMIRRARSLFPAIDFRTGDAADLSFADERFEYVLFSFNGLDYVRPEGDRYVALREIHRVLRPGGTFAFSSHNPFYVLPADPTSPYGYYLVARFWLRNLRDGTATAAYKTDVLGDRTLDTYFISPRGQRRQLSRCGFRVCEVVAKESAPSVWLDPWPYYVAERPGS
ncbi:class I SAM-dependent methyltransferase [Halorussus sp. JP-T4]|nr:class I SAM-dependent methyltransferase [Halorussus sp. JP-T4]NHN61414.1 class I SAM-dependent methyltransferase [Halorussus sp. JP-T4]